MHRLTPALVVDADPRGLEALAYGFQGEGWSPTLTPDYAGASGAAARSASELAVVVIREPVGPAMAALRSLRDGTSASPLPVLVLGPEAIRQEVRSIAGVDFLALPAFVRDVLTASKLLAAVHSANGSTGEEAGVSGSLSEYGLFYLVRTMIGLGRSGILQVERANRRGEIRFSDGEVTGASVGSLQGSAALHQLLLWEEAALDLKLRASVHRGPFNQRPDDLIEEAERFLRDFAHASKDLGPIATVLTADLDRASRAGESLPTEVGPLVRLFDGQRTLGDALEDSPFRAFDTLRIVSRLVDLGILSQNGANEAPRKIPTPTLKIGPEMVTTMPAPVVPASDGQRPPAPAAPPPPQTRSSVAPKDQRTGSANRRKLRRERGTLEQRTLNRTPPLETIPTNPSPPSQEAAPTPPVTVAAVAEVPPPAPPSPASGELRTSGTIGARGELRSGNAREAARAPESASVVIDMGPADAPVVAPLPKVASGPVQAVGVMEGRRATVSQSSASPAAGSIEVDPALMAELAAHELASMPPTPPPVAAAPAPTAKSRPGAPAPEAAKPVPAAAQPAAVAKAAAAAPPAAPAVAHADVEPRPVGRRPSSEFNALESDFFAREADLYKQEHPETFDDLDHGRGGRPPTRR